jgi:hypothetical protein
VNWLWYKQPPLKRLFGLESVFGGIYGDSAMSQSPTIRDTGLRLDGPRFRHELRLRGVTAGTVAKLAHISPNTVSRCATGGKISARTLRTIVLTLTSLPVMNGASDLVAMETGNALTAAMDAGNE